jgi:hypothetical protein
MTSSKVDVSYQLPVVASEAYRAVNLNVCEIVHTTLKKLPLCPLPLIFRPVNREGLGAQFPAN